MVLRKSRECVKTLKEAVIQKHNSNGNAVEVRLNHVSWQGSLRRNTKSCGYITLNFCPATDSSITAILQLTKH